MWLTNKLVTTCLCIVSKSCLENACPNGWFTLTLLNRPQKIRRASRKPLALGWLTRAHQQQCAPSMLDARIPRRSSRSLSRPRRPTIGCRQVVLPKQRAVTSRQASARGQATQLTFLSYLSHALCTNKFSRKQGVFGHRAVLISGGRDVVGGF